MKRFIIRGYGQSAPLTIKVDDCDAYLLRATPWHVSGRGKRVTTYAGLGTTRTLDSMITEAPAGAKIIHINGDIADYTRANLKIKSAEAAC